MPSDLGTELNSRYPRRRRRDRSRKKILFQKPPERSVLSPPTTSTRATTSPSQPFSSALDPLTAVDTAAELQSIYIIPNNELMDIERFQCSRSRCHSFYGDSAGTDFQSSYRHDLHYKSSLVAARLLDLSDGTYDIHLSLPYTPAPPLLCIQVLAVSGSCESHAQGKV